MRRCCPTSPNAPAMPQPAVRSCLFVRAGCTRPRVEPLLSPGTAHCTPARHHPVAAPPACCASSPVLELAAHLSRRAFRFALPPADLERLRRISCRAAPPSRRPAPPCSPPSGPSSLLISTACVSSRSSPKAGSACPRACCSAPRRSASSLTCCGRTRPRLACIGRAGPAPTLGSASEGLCPG